MVDPDHAALSITRQCCLLSIARSSFYYEGTGESPLNLRLMRRIDEQFLETPFYGSRQMTRWLLRQGARVSRKRVRRLMRLLGLQGDLPTAQDVSAAPGAQGLSLPVARSADHAAEPRVVHGCDLYPIAARLSVPRRGDGLGRAARCCPGVCPTRSRRSSTMALRRSSTATRAANSPASTSPTCSRRLAFASRWTGKGRWMDNVFIERLWRSLKYECVYLSEFATGSQARTGIGGWMDFYDRRRPHSALNDPDAGRGVY